MLHFILKKLFWGVFRHLLSDKQYIYVRYWLENGFLPDLERPVRLSEKIHYLKLYDRNERRRVAANRLDVRDYVAKKIGEDHLVPLIGHYTSLTEEVWETLPQRFVLKAAHGAKMVYLVHDKSKEHFTHIRECTREWMNTDYYDIGREWVYKGLPRTIIAEELISETDGKYASDYKFLCFHGKVKLFHVDMDRFGEGRRNFFDENLRPVHINYRLPPKKDPVVLPENIREATELAEILSEDFNFIRVDLYLTPERIYFGELTNFPGNGFLRFQPDFYDEFYGRMLRL